MNRIERTLRDFYKCQDLKGLGKIYTPKKLRERMLEIAKPEKTDKILVLYNIEFASDFRDYENVVFASDDMEKNEIVEKAFGMRTVFIEDNKHIKKYFEGMTFDLIISNPPYNNNLDLKILKEIYNIGEKICFVHPVGWLLDNKHKNILYRACKELYINHYTYIEIFRTHEVFNAFTFVPSGIFLSNKNSEKTICVNDTTTNELYYPKSFNEIDIHGFNDVYMALKKKILEYTATRNLDLTRVPPSNRTETTVEFSRCSPSGRCVMLPIKQTKEKYEIIIPVNNMNESENMKTFLRTKIARFCLSIYKLKQDLNEGELASVPYMPTYDRPWTDEEVAAELGLTQEELAWAINWIPDYYPEDKEKYAKYNEVAKHKNLK